MKLGARRHRCVMRVAMRWMSSGRIKHKRGSLLLVEPILSTTAGVQFKPGMLVKLPEDEWGCALFESNGFQFIGTLPSHLIPKQSEIAAGIECPPESFVQLVHAPLQVSLPTSLDGLYGQVLDPYTLARGAFRDEGESKLDVFRSPPSQTERQVIFEALRTGLTSVDALTPMGRGQSMLVMGEEGLGHSDLALDALRTQKNTDVTCIFSALGYSEERLAQLKGLLDEAGVLHKTMIVAPPDSDEPVDSVVATATACALAEAERDAGRHALVVLDDLRDHLRLWDSAWALGTNEISGQVDKPIDISQLRTYYSPLLQRAGKLTDTLGGGSMSLLALVNTPVDQRTEQTSNVVYTLDELRTLGASTTDLER